MLSLRLVKSCACAEFPPLPLLRCPTRFGNNPIVKTSVGQVLWASRNYKLRAPRQMIHKLANLHKFFELPGTIN